MSADGAPRCAWSNRAEEGTREIVLPPPHPRARAVVVQACPGHEQRVRAYYDRMRRQGTATLGAVVALLVAAPFMALLNRDVGMALLLALCGALLLAFPFPTPQTLDRIGIARSLLLLRVLAVALLAFAALFLLAALI